MNEIISNVVIGVMVAVCIAAGIFVWWMENGPDLKNKDEKQTDQDEEQNIGGQ